MMDFTWFLVGLLTSGAIIFLYEANQRVGLDLLDWAGLLTGFGLILFAVPWAVGSILEGVPRAASMGLLLFGLPGIVAATFSWKRLSPRLKETPPPATTITAVDAPTVQATILQAGPGRIQCKPTNWPKPIAYAAYAVLSATFVFAVILADTDYTQMLKDDFPDAEVTVLSNEPPAFELRYPDGTVKYAAAGTGQGYGGPLVVGVLVNSDSTLEKVKLLTNQETPAYRQRVSDAGFPSQFLGKKADDNFIVGEDIDAVTGATVSCVAGTQAIRSAAHLIALNNLELKPTWKGEPFRIGVEQLCLLIILIAAFISKVHKTKWARYAYLLATMMVVGFWTNACLSIGSLGALFMGYVPAFKSNPTWWMLVGTTVGAALILGRNIWCNKVCPFFAVQYFLNKIGRSRVKLPDWTVIHGGKIISFLLWLSLMTIFITRNPALGSYEPFSMMFSLNGVGIQWYLLPASIMGAFSIPLFWCRFFCPLGHCIKRLVSVQKTIRNRFKPTKEPPHGK